MNDSLADVLDTALSNVERAKEYINQLKLRVDHFLGNDNAAIVVKVNPQSAEKIVHAVVNSARIPEEITTGASCAARTLLKIFYDVARAFRADTVPAIPPASIEIHHSARMHRVVRRLSGAAADDFEQLEVYPGGYGEPLWIIDRVARLHANKLLEKVPFPDKAAMGTFASENRVSYIKDAQWDPRNKSLILFRVPPHREVNDDIKIAVNIVFCWPYMTGQKRSVDSIPAISILTDAAGNIVTFIHALNRRIGRDMDF